MTEKNFKLGVIIGSVFFLENITELDRLINGIKYSRMDQVKFVEDIL